VVADGALEVVERLEKFEGRVALLAVMGRTLDGVGGGRSCNGRGWKWRTDPR
jgi:hypothetical protein